MRNFILFVFGLFGVGLLFGCGDHSKDYLKHAQSIPPLVVPSDAAPLKQKTLYPIPKISSNHLSKQSTSLKPPTMQ